MTTVEKLFVQIFERKNSIIQQIKHHTEIYSQHLASKCLIEGITPPPWLWNPNFQSQSSDLKELKKQGLISELLLPQTQSTSLYSRAHCPLHNQPVVNGDNGQLSDLVFGETRVSGEVYDAGDQPERVPECCENEVVCRFNHVTDLDNSINSPQEQMEAKIPNIYTATDQSLARIQRSRSRQKALELRNSAKAIAKSRLFHENNRNLESSESMLSKNASREPNCGNEIAKLDKTFDICGENSVVKEAKEGGCQSNGKEKSVCCKITRSRSSLEQQSRSSLKQRSRCSLKQQSSSLKQLSFTSVSLELDAVHNISNKDGGTEKSEENLFQNPNHFNGNFEVLKTSDVTAENCGVSEGISDSQNHKKINSSMYSDRITRSRNSGEQHSPVNMSSELDESNFIAKSDCANLEQSIVKSKQGLCDTDELLESIEPSGELFVGRDNRSEVTCSSKDISKLVYNSSVEGCRITQSSATEAFLGANIFIQSEGHEFQNVSGSQRILPCHEILIIDQEGRAKTAGAIHLASDGPEAQCVCSGSNLDHANIRTWSEGFVAGPSSDCCILMKPKQLDFDNLDECNLNQVHSPTLNERLLDEASENKHGTLWDGATLLKELVSERPKRSPLKSNLSAGKEILRKAEENWKGSLETDIEELQYELELMKPGSTINENNSVRNTEDTCETVFHRECSLASHEVRGTPLDACQSTNREMHEFMCHLTENHEPSVELQVEKGCRESGNPTSLNTAKGKQLDLDLSHDSSLTKQASQEGDLLKGLGVANSSSIAVHETRKSFGCKGSGSPTSPNTTKGKQLDLGLSHVSSLTKQASQEGYLLKELGLVDSSSVAVHETRKSVEFCCENLDNSAYTGDTLEKTIHLGEEVHESGQSCEFCCENLDTSAYTIETLAETTTYLGEDGLLKNVSAGSPHSEYRNDCCIKSTELQQSRESSLPEAGFSIIKTGSWPKLKRRKSDSQILNCFSTFPSTRLQKLHSFKENHSGYSETVRHNSDTVISLQASHVSHDGDVCGSNINKSAGLELGQNMKCRLTEEIVTSCEQSVQEGKLCSEQIDKNTEAFSSLNDTCDISSWTKKASRDSQDFSFKEMGIADPADGIFDVRKSCDKQDYQQILQLDNKLNLVNRDDFPCSEKTLWDRKSLLEHDKLLSSCSVLSAQNSGSDFSGPDQGMPMFEGFIIDPKTGNGEPNITASGINVGHLDLSNTAIERTSILEQICKSASMCTPFAQLSSTFELHRTQDLHQSIPNGVLEHMASKSTLDHTVSEQYRPNYSNVDERSTARSWRACSDRIPYSGTRYGWNSRNVFTSPVGKLWKRLSLNCGSSETRLSSNPELTCFPIEEDPSNSEGNENTDELMRKLPEDLDYADREPLADTTEACSNPPAYVSSLEKNLDRESEDTTIREVSFAATRNRVKQKPEIHYSNKRKCMNKGNENRDLSIGVSGGKKANELPDSRSSKPKLSGKTRLRNRVPRASAKAYKQNNIVSNMTSFIPLVQQKQAAAVCTGKRGIKVKALEAAEAAKRVAEKRENERKMRKETLKLERVRMEQENLRRMEFCRKVKEVEQKKKYADVAARKRMRQEEERKEREKKRKRIESRHQQREHKENSHVRKMEKEKPCNVIGEKVPWNESNDELKECERMEKEREDVESVKNPESERTSVVLTSDIQHDNTAIKDSDENANIKEIGTLDISIQIDDLAGKTSLEKSYDISPYQCSDDEEEEEDSPARKFIPSWASKNCVALALLSKQKLDPDMIFPQEGFCSMDEVLLPRKLQQK